MRFLMEGRFYEAKERNQVPTLILGGIVNGEEIRAYISGKEAIRAFERLSDALPEGVDISRAKLTFEIHGMEKESKSGTKYIAAQTITPIVGAALELHMLEQKAAHILTKYKDLPPEVSDFFRNLAPNVVSRNELNEVDQPVITAKDNSEVESRQVLVGEEKRGLETTTEIMPTAASVPVSEMGDESVQETKSIATVILKEAEEKNPVSAENAAQAKTNLEKTERTLFVGRREDKFRTPENVVPERHFADTSEKKISPDSEVGIKQPNSEFMKRVPEIGVPVLMERGSGEEARRILGADYDFAPTGNSGSSGVRNMVESNMGKGVPIPGKKPAFMRR